MPKELPQPRHRPATLSESHQLPATQAPSNPRSKGRQLPTPTMTKNSAKANQTPNPLSKGRQLPTIERANRLPSVVEYRVGPRNPPKQYQFQKGQSGNPLGAKLRKRSIAPDLKAMLERALRQKVRKREGEKVLTKAAAGIEELVDQFAKGDRQARRDLILIAEKLDIDLTAGQRDALKTSVVRALSQNDQAVIDEYIEHCLAEREAQQQNLQHNSSAAEMTIETKM